MLCCVITSFDSTLVVSVELEHSRTSVMFWATSL